MTRTDNDQLQPDCGSCCKNPVEIARATAGTPTQKLIAVLIASGITTTTEIAAILGVTVRAVQKAKANLSSRTTVRNEPEFANHSSQPKKEIPPTPPKEKTTTLVEPHHSHSQLAPAREPALAGGESDLECRVMVLLGSTGAKARGLIQDLRASHGETALREGFGELASKAASGEPIRNPWKALPAFVASAATRKRCGTIAGDEIARRHREVNRRLRAKLMAEGYI